MAQAGYSYRNCEICGMSLPIGMSMAGHLEAHANDKISVWLSAIAGDVAFGQALKPLVDLPYACAWILDA